MDKGGSFMNHSLYRPLILGSVLWLAGFISGCTTVITPLSISDTISPDENHGLLIGNVQLAWHDPDKLKGRAQRLRMKWSIEEVTQGKRIVIADLPTAGPFVVKLPAGSYRINGIRFEDHWGTWHTMLSTAFQVSPGSCTSLGTWKLQRETESLADWITGHLFKDLEPTHVELQQIVASRDCTTLAELSVRSRLSFQNRMEGYEF